MLKHRHRVPAAWANVNTLCLCLPASSFSLQHAPPSPDRHTAAANTTVATPSTADQITTFTTFSQAGAAGTSNSAFQLGQQVARRCILDQTSTALVTNTGWAFHNTSGIYSTPSGTDYLLRARKHISMA